MSPAKTHITGIRTVSIPVDDQDGALGFYVDTLGFTTLRDNPAPHGRRWIELAPDERGAAQCGVRVSCRVRFVQYVEHCRV